MSDDRKEEKAPALAKISANRQSILLGILLILIVTASSLAMRLLLSLIGSITIEVLPSSAAAWLDAQALAMPMLAGVITWTPAIAVGLVLPLSILQVKVRKIDPSFEGTLLRLNRVIRTLTPGLLIEISPVYTLPEESLIFMKPFQRIVDMDLTESGGQKLPIKLLIESQFTDSHQGYLVRDAVDNVIGLTLGQVNSALVGQSLIEVNTDATTPSQIFTINEKIAGEGFLMGNGGGDIPVKGILGIEHYECLRVRRLSIQDLTLPEEYQEFARLFWKEVLDTKSLQAQDKQAIDLVRKMKMEGVTPDAAVNLANATYNDGKINVADVITGNAALIGGLEKILTRVRAA